MRRETRFWARLAQTLGRMRPGRERRLRSCQPWRFRRRFRRMPHRAGARAARPRALQRLGSLCGWRSLDPGVRGEGQGHAPRKLNIPRSTPPPQPHSAEARLQHCLAYASRRFSEGKRGWPCWGSRRQDPHPHPPSPKRLHGVRATGEVVRLPPSLRVQRVECDAIAPRRTGSLTVRRCMQPAKRAGRCGNVGSSAGDLPADDCERSTTSLIQKPANSG